MSEPDLVVSPRILDELIALRVENAALSADLENVQTENDQRAIEVAALKDLLSSIRAYKVIDAEVIGWIDAALADKPLSGPTP